MISTRTKPHPLSIVFISSWDYCLQLYPPTPFDLDGFHDRYQHASLRKLHDRVFPLVWRSGKVNSLLCKKTSALVSLGHHHHLLVTKKSTPTALESQRSSCSPGCDSMIGTTEGVGGQHKPQRQKEEEEPALTPSSLIQHFEFADRLVISIFIDWWAPPSQNVFASATVSLLKSAIGSGGLFCTWAPHAVSRMIRNVLNHSRSSILQDSDIQTFVAPTEKEPRRAIHSRQVGTTLLDDIKWRAHLSIYLILFATFLSPISH